MALIERYIFRIAFLAFLACLLGLTSVIWITQALRELDLLTGKGQTILVFLTITGLSLPAMITVISPVALFIATIYTLNKLNGDSELIVMSAAGIAPFRLLKPFLGLTTIVCFIVAGMTLYLMPTSFQNIRDLVTKIRADFVANIVKEGQFTSLDNGITFHYRERSGNALLGIFMQDRREEGRTLVYLAERGQTLESNGQSYLVLEKGSIQRQQDKARDSSIVAFDRYALDLSAFGQDAGETVYKPRERSTFDLLIPDQNDKYYQLQGGRFRAELHDRLSSWIYPIAMMMIAFAALGEARTTRQGRGLAVTIAILAVVALRIAGFAASSAVVRTPYALIGVYGAPVLTIVVSLLIALQGSGAKKLTAFWRSHMRRLALPRARSA